MEIRLDGHEKADDRGIELDRRSDKFKDRGRQDHRLGDDQFDYLIAARLESPIPGGTRPQVHDAGGFAFRLFSLSPSIGLVLCLRKVARLRSVFKLTCGSRGNRVRVGARGASATP
jgi:hypothetical protein